MTCRHTQCGAASAPKHAPFLLSAPIRPSIVAPALNQTPCCPPPPERPSPAPPVQPPPASANPPPAIAHRVFLLRLSASVLPLRPSQSRSAGFHVAAPLPAD